MAISIFKKPLFWILALVIVLVILSSNSTTSPDQLDGRTRFWNFQSIDTMKYSRDIAREKLKDSEFTKTIDTHVKTIAQAGATHVAIATPYDGEFYPFLKQWVDAARKYKLNVWFRGNFAGWEKWFGYPAISREEHKSKIAEFIKNHPDIFADGDVFSACPECENGGPGDPRRTGDTQGHRDFLISEYKMTQDAFAAIGKNVGSNYNSMNGDVARLIMDKPTTQSLGGIVAIDHYVASPQVLARDIKEIAQSSGGKIILGEFGAPIPDIHGKMNEDEQAKWISDSLKLLSQLPELEGLNYWVGFGGSTMLWNSKAQPLQAAEILAAYFKPLTIKGQITDELFKPIAGANILTNNQTLTTDKSGNFALLLPGFESHINVTAHGYNEKIVQIDAGKSNYAITLELTRPDWWFTLRKSLLKAIKPL